MRFSVVVALGLFASSLLPLPLSAVEIVAHRGASEDAPENTLAAVNLGWKQNADVVEIDVALTKDGEVVVIHDSDTSRLGGCDRAVAEQTVAELRKLDVGGWKGDEYRGERIPLLTEVLATVPAGRRLFVEIKCGPEVLPALDRVFSESRVDGGQVTIIGFGYETMAAAKRLFPEIPVYWISRKAPRPSGDADPARDALIAQATEAGLDGLHLQAWDTIDATFVRAVKAAGLDLVVWTVDDGADARRLAAAGVDGITTNRPGYLRTQLRLTVADRRL